MPKRTNSRPKRLPKTCSDSFPSSFSLFFRPVQSSSFFFLFLASLPRLLAPDIQYTQQPFKELSAASFFFSIDTSPFLCILSGRGFLSFPWLNVCCGEELPASKSLFFLFFCCRRRSLSHPQDAPCRGLSIEYSALSFLAARMIQRMAGFLSRAPTCSPLTLP